MSDGQTFLLLLSAFYALECFTMAPAGSAVYVRGFRKHHRLRPCLLEFGGIKRELYFLHLLPWPGRARVVSKHQEKETPQARRLPSARRYLRVLDRAAEPLVMNGVLLWFIFFVVLPVTYWRNPLSDQVLLLAICGYVLIFWQTGCYWCLHRRFFPERGEERLKGILTMAVLPWHGMKAANHLTLHPKLPLGSLEAQALLLAPKAFEQSAKPVWRRASHGGDASEGEMKTLSRFFDDLGVEWENWDTAPERLTEGERYCPICHCAYEPKVSECRDCGGVKLVVK